MTNKTNQNIHIPINRISELEKALQISSVTEKELNKIDKETLIFASKEENQSQLIELFLEKLKETDPEHVTPQVARTAAVEARKAALMRLEELNHK